MWIVNLALARPRMVAVMAIAILLFGSLTIIRTPKDMFPAIDIPVVSIIWSYGGLAPQEMEQRVISRSERTYTTTVGNIEHIESQSLPGVGVIRVFFQPGTPISQAVAQLSTASQTVLRGMPPGTPPPLMLQYNASDVPVLQMSLSSDTMPITDIVDFAQNSVRNQLVTIQGVSVSPPFGGVPREISVDLDPSSLTSHQVTAQEVTQAISNQNLILPAGQVRMGVRDYMVRLNNSPTAVDEINNLPLKMTNGATLYVRDVAQVRQGYGTQSSMVRVNGKPSVLITILKSGNASTLDVVNRVKAALPQIRATLPEGMHMDLLLDQSVFVRGAVEGVVREAIIAAGLTALMILLFLGSWRSTLIVAISIPLSIFASIAMMGLLGQTLNTLTLGGLALAVGILVDDATVEVENTTRNLALGVPLHEAILLSAQQVALPALSSTLAICIVFVPVAFLAGVSRSLFMPLAAAVVLAMLPSYFLSRTLVTTMMQSLMAKELELHVEAEPHEEVHASRRTLLWRAHEWIEHRFEQLRDRYRGVLAWALDHRGMTISAFLAAFAITGLLFPLLGQDFFPPVDAGQMRLHVRAPAGTRLEETAKIFTRIEGTIREALPEREVALILDNIGLPGALNYAFSNSGTIGGSDGEIIISLEEKHSSTFQHMQTLRRRLATEYPDCTFYFQPADIATQVLNFGTSAPIDIQVTGPYRNQEKNYAVAQQIRQEVAKVPGIVDAYVYQVTDAPELRINVDRDRAQQFGVTQQNVAGNILVSLSSSSLTSPSYFIDPKNGVQYTVSVRTPQYKVRSIDALLNTPVATTTGSNGQRVPQLLSNVAEVSRDTTPSVVSHYNIQPVYNVYCNVQDRDLGGATNDVQKLLTRMRKQLPRGSTLNLVGQADTMQTSFRQMGFGLIFAVVLVYLLLTVTYESWKDPLVILTATPGALAGVVWMLYATQTTLNVPSLMGSIMSIGVATANSILLVTFANEQQDEGKSIREAALEAGYTRLRPVIMTALAMILGMLPMALGLGEGGAQNAPLGRAVIGGLCVATFSTLLFVPLMYTFAGRHEAAAHTTSPHPAGTVRPARVRIRRPHRA
jgi:CzcA family heavy metal efflux pump